MLKSIGLVALALLAGFSAGFAYQTTQVTEKMMLDTKAQLLNRQDVNEVGYTATMFTADIDPRSEGFTAPQNDTLYSSVWFDLTEEPQVIIQGPSTPGRYWVHELVTPGNVVTAYIGSLSDGNDAGVFLVAPESWDGEVPAGITRVVRVATEEVWDLYRFYSANTDDFPIADAERRDIEIVSLSEFALQERAYTSPIWYTP
jgi:hypothetical protein